MQRSAWTGLYCSRRCSLESKTSWLRNSEITSKTGCSQINVTVLLLNLPKPDQGWAHQQSEGVLWQEAPWGLCKNTVWQKNVKKSLQSKLIWWWQRLVWNSFRKLVKARRRGSIQRDEPCKGFRSNGPRRRSCTTVGLSPGWLRSPRHWK